MTGLHNLLSPRALGGQSTGSGTWLANPRTDALSSCLAVRGTMSKSSQAACLNIETDLEKTAEHYDRSIVAGWEGLYARMRGAFWSRADRLVGPSDRVLELGCGDGEITGHLARSCKELVVVDGSRRMLDMSRDRIGDLSAASARVSFVHSWFEEYNPDEAFDLVVMAHILEHMDEPIELLRRATRWLRPGGRLLALVPNAGSLHRRVAAAMLGPPCCGCGNVKCGGCG
mgnify:CR=1 FL=1